jgi:3-deoxy-D-manno-octulosonic-acid transferase
MLASSREGEEQLWLDAIAEFERTDPQMAQSQPRIQWWIVPRHPQRFDEVEQLLRASGKNSGKKILRKSVLDGLIAEQQATELHTVDIVLGDTMGEMFTYYAIADIVLMGGTWLPYGGQNFLEPMALGKTVWVGTSIYNFEQIGVDAIDNGVLWQAQSLVEALAQTKQTEQYITSMHTRIRTYINEQCGTVKKLREKLEM